MIPAPKYSLGTKIKIGQKQTIISMINYDEGKWTYSDDDRRIDTTKKIEIEESGNWQPELKIGHSVIGLNVVCGIGKSKSGNWVYRIDIPDSSFPCEEPMWLTKEEIEQMFPNSQ